MMVFDIVFVTVIALFALLGFINGFLKSVFDVVNWIAAALVAYFLTPYVADFFGQKYSYLVVHAVTGVVLFIVTSVILHFATASFSKTLLNVIPKPVDKSLGFAFGLVKGYFLASLAFVLFITIYAYNSLEFISKSDGAKDKKKGPEWLVKSQSYSILTIGGDMWRPLVNSGLKGFLSVDTGDEISDEDLDKKDLEKKILGKKSSSKKEVEEANLEDSVASKKDSKKEANKKNHSEVKDNKEVKKSSNDKNDQSKKPETHQKSKIEQHFEEVKKLQKTYKDLDKSEEQKIKDLQQGNSENSAGYNRKEIDKKDRLIDSIQ